MTCIVALVDHDRVYFAGDSLVVNAPGNKYSKLSQTVRRTSKVWTKDGMVFGGHGDERALQLLRYEHETPLYSAGQDAVNYLVSTFIPSMQKCFLSHEFRSDGIDGEILLSIENKLFAISSDFQVCDPAWTFYCVGQAAPIVEGSLSTTGRLKLPPLQRLSLALLAAEHHSDVVAPPFLYITSEMEQPEMLP